VALLYGRAGRAHAKTPILGRGRSTGDGAILAMGTVWAHNIMKKFRDCVPALGER
jgi:hypothetical protein